MNEPLISIIIPVFNGENFLNRCFYNIERQKYSNFEVIFINNLSTDKSKKILQSYCKNTTISTKLIDCNKQGPGYARNEGIKVANGKFISFLDVDDEISPNKHYLLIEKFKKYPKAGMAIGNTMKEYSDGRKLSLNIGKLDEFNNSPNIGLLWLKYLMLNPTTCSYLVRAEILNKNNIQFATINYGEDIAFNILVGINFDVIYTNQLVCTYHRHSQSALSNANKNMISLERYFQFYNQFALPFFYYKKDEDIFLQAYHVCESRIFRILMKLIYYEKKNKYLNVLNELENKSLISNFLFRKTLFKYIPFNVAYYLNDKLFNFQFKLIN